MGNSKWVGDLACKFRQRLQELVDSSQAGELTAATFRTFIEDLRSLVNAVGLEALVRRVEDADEVPTVLEIGGERLRYRGREEKEWLTPFGKAKVRRRRYAREGGGLSVVPLDAACGMTGRVTVRPRPFLTARDLGALAFQGCSRDRSRASDRTKMGGWW